ncbi:MAG: antibiotic biosynthesis monooxygenase [Pseudonocardia sp.]|nr:antibiotic biosynthesis monooxygenase [Pseudonocardia sp.]
MLVVHVHVHVTPDDVDAFLAESRRNAEASLQEPGVRRFDLLQDESDPAYVVLTEVYVDQAAADAHKRTPHYARWRDAVAGMMAQPRASTRFTAVFPAEDGW